MCKWEVDEEDDREAVLSEEKKVRACCWNVELE